MREIRPALLALFAGVGILLAIACVNVASLLIARAAARRPETALRLALGAARGRLLRQWLAEGLLLAMMGAAGGLGTGWLVLRGLIALRPDSLSRIDLASVDLPVAAFTLGVALLWGVLFSLAPLVEVFRADLLAGLQRGQRQGAVALRYGARRALVVAQIAMSVVLLACAVLLVRAFARVQQVDPGFRTGGALTFRVAIPLQRYRPMDTFNAFCAGSRKRSPPCRA